jgi:hypothetical protein
LSFAASEKCNFSPDFLWDISYNFQKPALSLRQTLNRFYHPNQKQKPGLGDSQARFLFYSIENHFPPAKFVIKTPL